MVNVVPCDICMKHALSQEPTYFGYLHEEPRTEKLFESADELKTAAEDNLIYGAFARWGEPAGQENSHSEFGIPLALVRAYRPEELDKFVTARLVEQLHTTDFHKQHQQT